jgi:ribosome-associated protein
MISLPIVTVRRHAPCSGLRSLNLSKHRTSAGQAPAPAGAAERSDEEAGDELDDALERPSRSARKRAAEALQKLGVALTRLRPAQLRSLQQQLQLPETLFEALLEAQRLRSRVALARQRQYIGRLMRTVDGAPIERALTEFSRSGDAKMAR